jgi:hypothetical protein
MLGYPVTPNYYWSAHNGNQIQIPLIQIACTYADTCKPVPNAVCQIRHKLHRLCCSHLAEILASPNPRKGIFFAHALTMLGLFCFHHFPKMIVLRRVVAQSLASQDFPVLEMIVLRRVVAHRATLTMLGRLQSIFL